MKIGDDETASEFNKSFADVGPTYDIADIGTKNIPDPSMPLEHFLKRVNTILPSQSLSVNELKDAFFFF